MVVEDYSSYVHDNIILSYFVDMKNHVLEFETVYDDYAKTIITFKGLLAHKFENVIQDNIIFGIEQISIEYYVEKNKVLLEKSLQYGFPVQLIRSVEELKKYLVEEGYKIYSILSSFGLDGCVIAKILR